MKLVNIDYIPGYEVVDTLGIVKGTIVQSKNIVRYGTSSVMRGAAEVIAYGTAVKIKKK